MMQAMRNNTKIIIWVVVIAFVGFMGFSLITDIFRGKSSGGAAPANVVGSVNGQDIPLREFGNMANQKIEAQRDKNPEKEFTESDYRAARREAWQDAVQQYLQMQQIDKKGIELTDDELYKFMLYYPPQEAASIEPFTTDGKFDYKKYQQAMANPQYENVWVYLEQLSRPRFTTYKLTEYIGGLVHVSKPEVREKYILDNERIKVRYGLVPLKDYPIGDIHIDSQVVITYYNSHKDDYYEDTKAYYKAIRASKEASERDDEQAYEDAMAVKREIDAGGDFEKLADQYTQDPGGKGKGGALGWFGRGKMVPEFDSAAFAMKVGEIAGPIKTQFGYHIIKKLDERQKDGETEVNVEHILFRPQISQSTLDALEIKVDDFRREVNSGGNIDSLVGQYGFTAQAERSVGVDGTIPTIGRDKELVDWLFTAPDTLSATYDEQSAYFLFACDRVVPAGPAPLDEVYYKILRKFQEADQGDKALAKIQKVYDKVMAGTDFAKACKDENVDVQESAFFARTGRIPGMGQDPDFIGTAFTLSEANRYSKPILTGAGAALLEYLDRLPAKLDQFEQLQDTLLVQARQPLQSSYWQKWFQGLIDNADIKDYRREQFGDKM